MGDKRTDPGQYYPGGKVVSQHGVAPPQIIVQWSDVQGKPQIAPLPDRYRDSDVKTKINEIASKFATLIVAAFIGWSACADVTVQKKRKDEIFNDELVVVDVTGGGGTDTNSVRDIAAEVAAPMTNALDAAKRDKGDLNVYEVVRTENTDWTFNYDMLPPSFSNVVFTMRFDDSGGVWIIDQDKWPSDVFIEMPVSGHFEETNVTAIVRTLPDYNPWSSMFIAKRPRAWDETVTTNVIGRIATTNELGASKQDALPYPTNAIPASVITGLDAKIDRSVSANLNTYVDGETGVEYVGKFYGGSLYYVPTGNVYPPNN